MAEPLVKFCGKSTRLLQNTHRNLRAYVHRKPLILYSTVSAANQTARWKNSSLSWKIGDQLKLLSADKPLRTIRSCQSCPSVSIQSITGRNNCACHLVLNSYSTGRGVAVMSNMDRAHLTAICAVPKYPDLMPLSCVEAQVWASCGLVRFPHPNKLACKSVRTAQSCTSSWYSQNCSYHLLDMQ